jgi:pimeloyl-ACP methyl ester carboxylesterase
MIRWFLVSTLVVFFAAVWAALVFVVAIKPEKIQSSLTPADYQVNYERLTLYTEDGLMLAGWLVPHNHSRAVIVIGHGYPFDKGAMLDQTIFLHQYFNLLYFDFRYFGESQGRYTTFGVKEKLDVKAVSDYIKQRSNLDAQQIGWLGYSFSAAAFIQANPDLARAMVLDSSFLSMREMAKGAYRWLPGPLKWPMTTLTTWYGHWWTGLDLDQASPLAHIAALTMPVLFLHGRADREMPFGHTVKLAARCTSQHKQLILLESAGHGINDANRRQVYREQVLAFFQHWLTKGAAQDELE